MTASLTLFLDNKIDGYAFLLLTKKGIASHGHLFYACIIASFLCISIVNALKFFYRCREIIKPVGPQMKLLEQQALLLKVHCYKNS